MFSNGICDCYSGSPGSCGPLVAHGAYDLGLSRGGAGATPVHYTIAMGQLGLFATFFVVLAMCFKINHRDGLAGAMLVLATAIKPQMGFFFLLFSLLRFRPRLWLSATVVGLALVAVSVGQLWIHHVDWIPSLQENYRTVFQPGALDAHPGESNDPGPGNPYANVLLNLQYPLSAMLPNPRAVNLLTLALTAAMGVYTLWVQKRNRGSRGELLTYAMVAVLGLLAVYHRSYDAVLLLLPLAWAFQSLRTPDRGLAILTIILISPFFLPTPDFPTQMAMAVRLPRPIIDNWWWRTLVMPYQVYALLLMAVCLFCAGVAQ